LNDFKEDIMRTSLLFKGLVFSAGVMFMLSACPPPDGVDLEAGESGNTGNDYEEVKRIIFDDLNAFIQTENPPSGGVINDWQRGGEAGPVVELSTEQDHTTGNGKSLKWSGRTINYQRIKFDKIFTAANEGKKFNISMWVYTGTATTVQLGTYRISGTGLDGTTAVDSKSFDITAGWNELVWDSYVHTDTDVTQLAIEQPNGVASIVDTFYIDDIVVNVPTGNSANNNSANNTITRESILAEINGKWQSMGYSQKPTKYMALTYDDGPSQRSEELLAALAAKNAKATFFLIGNRISGKEAVVRAMRDAGHELANHSFSHNPMGSLSVTDAETEIQNCTDAIYNATNSDDKPVTPKFFRAPNLNYGANLYTACINKGFALIGGHSTSDWNGGTTYQDPQAMADAQINNAKPWQIALSHDPNSGIPANILAAVPLMIDGLRAQGYYLLTLSELLIMRNAGALTTGKVYVDFASIP
jgi:peptidoglycan/xylan/chitin deacetylase (PgdA/CDA1 family)